MFAGNSFTASAASPSKIIVCFLIKSKLMLEFSKNFAPLRDFGCFVVTRVSDSSSSLTDFIASRPAMAPDGRMICFLNSLQASINTSKTD